jgi:hypothetical protein
MREGSRRAPVKHARGWTCFEGADSRDTDRKQTKMTRPALFFKSFPFLIDLISGFFPFYRGCLFYQLLFPPNLSSAVISFLRATSVGDA